MNTTNNNNKSLIGDALGFAYSSIFERGIMGFLQWVAVYLAILAITVSLWFSLGVFNRFTGLDLFSNSFIERADGTWAPPIPYFILTLIWLYVIIIPIIQCIVLNFYDTRTMRPTSLLSLFSTRKIFSFLIIALLPILFVETVRYQLNPSNLFTSHYQFNLNQILLFTFAVKSDTTSLLIQIFTYTALMTLGILLASRFIFAGYFIIDKNNGPLEALQASWNLTQGKTCKMFGLIFTMLVIFTLIKDESSISHWIGLVSAEFFSNSAMLTSQILHALRLMTYLFHLICWPLIGLMTAYTYRRLEK